MNRQPGFGGVRDKPLLQNRLGSPFLHTSTCPNQAKQYHVRAIAARKEKPEQQILVKIDLWGWFQSGLFNEDQMVDLSSLEAARRFFKKGQPDYGLYVEQCFFAVSRSVEEQEILIKWRGTVPLEFIERVRGPVNDYLKCPNIVPEYPDSWLPYSVLAAVNSFFSAHLETKAFDEAPPQGLTIAESTLPEVLEQPTPKAKPYPCPPPPKKVSSNVPRPSPTAKRARPKSAPPVRGSALECMRSPGEEREQSRMHCLPMTVVEHDAAAVELDDVAPTFENHIGGFQLPVKLRAAFDHWPSSVWIAQLSRCKNLGGSQPSESSTPDAHEAKAPEAPTDIDTAQDSTDTWRGRADAKMAKLDHAENEYRMLHNRRLLEHILLTVLSSSQWFLFQWLWYWFTYCLRRNGSCTCSNYSCIGSIGSRTGFNGSCRGFIG